VKGFLVSKTLKFFTLAGFVVLLIFTACENPFMKEILDPKTVYFNSNGGSPVPSQNLLKNETVKRPADPVKTDFIFEGWFSDNNSFLNEWNFNVAPTEDMTLYAKWRSYGILLFPDNIVFEPQEFGYAAAQLFIVQVQNTSEEPTGELTITLSGTGADAFTLSGSNMPSLNYNETLSFDVSNNTGLSIGTYTAVVTVSNGGNVSARLNLSFTVTGIPLYITDAVHTKQYDGLTTAAGVTLTLDGIRPGDDVYVDTVTANYTNANAGTNTINITNVTLIGSAAGNYSVQIENPYTVAGGITKADGAAVTKPTVTGNSEYLLISVSTTLVSNTGQSFEYALIKDTAPLTDNDWKTGSTFNLELGTIYYVYARSASNGNYETGATSERTEAAFYTVTFNPSNGTTGSVIPVFNGYTVSKPADPIYTGYTFGGWYISASVPWNFTTNTVTENITLSAIWNPNTAEITIDVEQITEGVSIPADVIKISRTGDKKTHTVTVNNPSLYSSITWAISGVGINAGQTFTDTGESYTLDATDVRYNSVSVHTLRLTVIKDGVQYLLNIDFEIED